MGNFCPYCSQRSGLGPITWRSVSKGIAEVWGMHSRSLPFTVLQLFLRPGYIIGDYISGKRQVSFPPVKMLALIAVLGVIVDFMTGAIHGMISYEIPANHSVFLYKVFHWVNTHPDLMSLILLSSLIIPNHIIYRFAPRHSSHTLPQGFFIQVFSSTILLLFNMFYDVTSIGWLALALGGSIVFFLYKQLFGYGVWGTLWRVVIGFTSAFAIFYILLGVDRIIYLTSVHHMAKANQVMIQEVIVILGVITALSASYFISKATKAKSTVAQ
ncbi:MAG: DUF3667 domain-containing protein [Muribaculaceae bacterium]|nr:DUF3667 domain-containing protein [Muribaculaceae bacterium]